MPYKVRKRRPGRWVIIKDGRVVGHSRTKHDAQASVRARQAGGVGRRR